MKLKDKVALITGGAQGIGYEIASLFAKEGADIIVADLNPEALNQARVRLEELGGLFPHRGQTHPGGQAPYRGQVLTVEVDVGDFSQVEQMFEKSLDKFKRIDILINNAGITRDGLLLRMKETDWDAVLRVNLKGCFNCTKAAARIMLKQRAGKIVNIASIIGLIGNIGQANYAASKAGLIGLTKSTARELAARNINVTAIAPGFIQTEMTAKLPAEAKQKMLAQIPLGKFGGAKDVARAALFLVSEESSYITGQVIRVCGGMVM